MNKEEIGKLKDFISFYKVVQSDIEDLELQIKEIDNRKKTLISLITNKRNEENDFIEKLKVKYGEETVSIENLKKILL